MASFANLEQQYREVKGLKKEYVDQMFEWLETQHHLPKMSELQMVLFLNSCYFSHEATKITIDNFFTSRTHCPEFFADQNPNSSSIKNVFNIGAITPMPNLTPEGYTILYSRVVDLDVSKFVFNDCFKYFDMTSLLHLHERGALNGHLLVIDFQGATIGHLLRVGPLAAKKMLYYLQEAAPFRLVGAHFVNSVSFMDKVMALLKPFMGKALLDVLEIHYGDNATIFKKIPSKCLPVEVGGTSGLSIVDVHKEFYTKVLQNTDFYQKLGEQLVDESRRPGKPKNAGDLFGVEGTFKKLDID